MGPSDDRPVAECGKQVAKWLFERFGWINHYERDSLSDNLYYVAYQKMKDLPEDQLGEFMTDNDPMIRAMVKKIP